MPLRRDPFVRPEPLIQRVYAYVAYRIGDGPDAEDVTSDTFERALRYADSFDASKGEPVAWLIGIARRCIAEWSTRELVVPADAIETSTDGDLEDDVVRRLTVAAAVSRLDERDRELVALRYGADLTTRQIGELLGARTNTVEVALHRALARLRTALEETPVDAVPSFRPAEGTSPS